MNITIDNGRGNELAELTISVREPARAWPSWPFCPPVANHGDFTGSQPEYTGSDVVAYWPRRGNDD